MEHLDLPVAEVERKYLTSFVKIVEKAERAKISVSYGELNWFVLRATRTHPKRELICWSGIISDPSRYE